MLKYDFKDIRIIKKDYINYSNDIHLTTYSLKYAVYILGIKFYFWFVPAKEGIGSEFCTKDRLIEYYNRFANSNIKKTIKTIIK